MTAEACDRTKDYREVPVVKAAGIFLLQHFLSKIIYYELDHPHHCRVF